MPVSRGKILALHGVAQSGPVFARKSSTITATLTAIGYEFVFLTGTCDITGTAYTQARQSDWKEGDLERSWWETDDENEKHTGIEHAMQIWGDAMREHGPFVGALGFSQGGCAAASIAAMLEPSRRSNHLTQKYFPAYQPPLEFLILFSGNPYRFPTETTYWLFYPQTGKSNKLDTRTLYFYGEKEWERDDFSKHRQSFLISRLNNVKAVGHPWKHTVPRTQKYADMAKEFVSEKDVKKIPSRKKVQSALVKAVL